MHQTFGEWVSDQRQRVGLTKSECARRAGISCQRWAQIEQAPLGRRNSRPPRPELKTVRFVAYALSADLNEALRAAGLPQIAEEQQSPPILAYYNGLPTHAQEDMLEMARALYRRYKSVELKPGS